MRSIKTPDTNKELGRPVNWDDDKGIECSSLPVHAYESNGYHFMLSVWRPSPEERDKIANGGDIVLTVIGSTHPPVTLHVSDEQEL